MFLKKWLTLPKWRQVLFLFVICCTATWNGDASGPMLISNQWSFQHVIVDQNPLATYRINDLQLADMNGDGRLDIWTSGRGGGNTAYQMVWYCSPDWKRYEIAPGDYKYGDLGDLDGDGDLDLVAGNSWFENTGQPEQPDWPKYDLGYSEEPDLMLLGDLNRDGWLDIVFTTKHAAYYLPGPARANAPFARFLIFEDTQERRTGGTLADLDQDGDLDLLWGNAWFENLGASHHGPWPKHLIDPAWPAEARGAVGDLDRDGKPDVVLSGEESRAGIAWYSSASDSASRPWIKQRVVSRGYEGVHSLALVDLDLDGDLDIFAAEMHTGNPPHKVSVFENVDMKGTGWHEHIIATGGSHNARVGDLNQDGYPDIAGKNFQAGTLPLRVEIWLNRRGSLPQCVSPRP